LSLLERGGDGGLGVDADALAREVVCTACGRASTAGHEAQELCAQLTARLGPDPLRLRWLLAVRGVGRAANWTCAACTPWGGEPTGGFRGEQEHMLSAAMLQRVQRWFGLP
jgi:hypothetical protein